MEVSPLRGLLRKGATASWRWRVTLSVPVRAIIAISLFALVQIGGAAGPAIAMAPVDDGPSWVAKYTRYFNELNNFLKKPCTTDAERTAARDIWLPANNMLDDEMADLAAQVKKLEDKVLEIDDRIKGITPEYKQAVEHSMRTVAPPPPPSPQQISRLQQQKAQLNEQADALQRKIAALRAIQDELRKLYDDILALPLCPDISTPPPPPPPPVPPAASEPVLRCGTATHQGACPACKAEANALNNAADAFSWAFGTKATCDELKAAVTKLGNELSACAAKKCRPPPEQQNLKNRSGGNVDYRGQTGMSPDAANAIGVFIGIGGGLAIGGRGSRGDAPRGDSR